MLARTRVYGEQQCDDKFIREDLGHLGFSERPAGISDLYLRFVKEDCCPRILLYVYCAHHDPEDITKEHGTPKKTLVFSGFDHTGKSVDGYDFRTSIIDSDAVEAVARDYLKQRDLI